MSNADVGDDIKQVKQHFKEDKLNYLPNLKRTPYSILIDERPNTPDEAKQEPLEDQIEKLNIFQTDEKYNVLENPMPCKEEPQDLLRDDCDVNAKLKKKVVTIQVEICQEICKDFCYDCQLVTCLLDVETVTTDRTKTNNLPNRVLEVKATPSGTVGVFAVKAIPEGIKFGPCGGLQNLPRPKGVAWKLKTGKFVDAATTGRLTWMSQVNCTSNPATQNLVIFQYENHLYYQSKRRIEKGEELLVYMSEEHASSFNIDTRSYYYPLVEDHIDNIYACTFCCVGFATELHLVIHRAKCKSKVSEVHLFEGIVRCSMCKIFLELNEYTEIHRNYCAVKYSSTAIRRHSGNAGVTMRFW